MNSRNTMPETTNSLRRGLRARFDRLFAGGRPDGPPDLDELWKDFNRKLGSLFGSRKGGDDGGGTGGGGNGFQPDVRSARVGLSLILGIVALIWLGSGVFIVQEGNQSVITTFGRYDHTVDAGMHWRLPYPVQANETVAVTQLRSEDIGKSTITQSTNLRDSSMLTKDENIVDIRFTVQYKLKDARAFLYENRNPGEAVVLASESAVREIVGRSNVDQVLYEQRDAIASDLVKLIQNQLDRLQAGVIVVGVNVRNVEVPEQVQAAFNDAVKAGADRDRFTNEGRAYASDVIPKAQGTAARLREEALGYQARIVGQAEGDADRFRQVYTEYQKAPGVTRDRMYIDTMREVYANVTKVMVDTRGSNNLINLPLDKLMQAGAASTAAAAGAATGGVATPPSTPTPSIALDAAADARSRDNARGRDRDGR
jgi:membrane protease subunit HflK